MKSSFNRWIYLYSTTLCWRKICTLNPIMSLYNVHILRILY